MKKFFVTIFLIIGCSVAGLSALPQLSYSSFTNEDLLGHLEKFYNDTTIPNQVKSEVLTKTIKEANRQLQELNSITKVEEVQKNNCQKLSQTLWEGKAQSDFNVTKDVISLNGFLTFHGFTKDDESENVQARQEWRHGYNQKTVIAVKKFQQVHGIKQTGTVGPLTLAKINSMICNK